MLLAAAIVILLIPAPTQAAYRFDEPETYLAAASQMPAWAATLQRHEEEKAALDACIADEDSCERRMRALRHVILRGSQLEPDEQIRLVNRYVNKRRYRDDRRKMSPSVVEGGQAKLRNQWSTLLEFVRRGGDCEDYATAKYFLLREMGFPAEDMRVVVSYDRSVRAHHAVLAVRRRDGSSWLLELDNTIRKKRHYGYRFIYALNEIAIWDHEN